jgi:hypothetical protein
LHSSWLNFLLLYSLFLLQLLVFLFIYLILFHPRSLSYLFEPLCRFVSLFFVALLTFSHITFVNVFMAVVSCSVKFEVGGEELVCNQGLYLVNQVVAVVVWMGKWDRF